MSQVDNPLFKDLFQGLPHPAILMNSDGECLAINDQYHQSIGAFPDEYPAHTYKAIVDMIQKVVESKVPGFLETSIQFSEFQIAAYLLTDEETVAVILEDITDQVKLALDYQNQEIGLKNYLEYTKDALACLTFSEPLDLSLPAEDRFRYALDNLRILECNDQYAHFQSEPSSKSVIGKRLVDILKEPPEGYEAKIRYSADNSFYIPGNLMHKIEPGNVEKFYYLTSIPVVDNGHVKFIWVSLQDVTSVIQNERALAKSQQRYQNFIRDSHEGIALYRLTTPIDIHLDEDEQIQKVTEFAVLQECNETWCKISGVSQDNALGMAMKDVTPMGENNFRRLITNFIENKYRVIDYNMEYFNRAENMTIHIELSLAGVIYEEQLIELWLIKQDVTTSKSQAKELQLRDQRMKLFIENSFEPILRIGFTEPMPLDLPKAEQPRWLLENARLMEANKPYVKWIGGEDDKPLRGRLLNTILKNPDNSLSSYEQFVASNYMMAPQEVLDQNFNSPDLRVSYLVSMQGVIEDNSLQEIWCVFRDITEQKKYIQQIEHQSSHDSLTGLPNRIALLNYLQELTDSRNQQDFAVMFIDLDLFKEVNDNLGHHSGDLLLKQLGPRLTNLLALHKQGGMVARLGGDEFAVVFLGVNEASSALMLGMALVEQIKVRFVLEGVSVHVGGSIGVALGESGKETASELMKQADIAMYRAKQERLGVAVYDPHKDLQDIRRLELMSDLRLALKENQLFLNYQPKIELSTGYVTGVEALLRWRHPKLGLVPPGEFIPVAESTDLIHELSMFVVGHALEECESWWSECEVPVAVNLSANNLMHPMLMRFIRNCFANSILPKNALEIEITESALMSNPDLAKDILLEMSELGISIAIDDFGTGYSSLAYLKDLPIKTLKIDNSFIRGILDDKKDSFIVDAVITLGKSMGMDIVGEGVESQRILNNLVEKSCTIAQGYHIGKPMTRDEFVIWYKNLPCKDGRPFFQGSDAA